MVVVIVYCICYGGSHFSLSFDVHAIVKGRKLRTLYIYNVFYSLLFLNMDISLTINVIDLKFSVCILKRKACLFYFLNLGSSFNLMAKKGSFLSFFSKTIIYIS